MITESAALTGVAASEEAIAFLARAGIGGVWTRVLELTRTVFPSARSIRAYAEDDGDIPGQRYLVCHVETPELDAARGADAWEEWHRGLSGLVPAAQTGTFCLRLELGN